VTNCTFYKGAGGGIRLDLYCQHIKIIGNHIHHIGGTGIYLGGYGPGLKDVNKDNLVIDNYIHHGALFFQGRPGIFIWQSGNNIITNNRIHTFPYNGITVSGVRPRFFAIIDSANWLYTKKIEIPHDLRENMRTIRWEEVGEPMTYMDVLQFAHARHNRIEANEIHDVMQEGGDGNGIYLSSGGEGNRILRNLVYSSSSGQAWGIRTDDDQHNTLMKGNIVIGKAFKIKHTNNRIENNIIINGGNEGVVVLTDSPDCRIYRNVFMNSTMRFVPKTRLTHYGDNSDMVYIDKNIYWGKKGNTALEFYKFSRDMGYDKNSLCADPGFKDPGAGLFELLPGSKGIQLGIESIRTDDIGLFEDPAFPRLNKEEFFDFLSGEL
jgi:hypothetical protein